ncbi:MAG: aminopeptidase [Burkholderiales bacterium]|nr:aminopeptidase [Burkholderiales bacterium]
MRDEGGAAARVVAVIVAASVLGGCANAGYYLQSIGGQFEIWRRERPIADVIRDPATPEALRARLRTVLGIREFASRELALPDNESYRRYADLARPYAVWNVFATAEFSVDPEQWCFPVAGCVSYRGYFSREGAERFAAELARAGRDVYVGPVPAYSTLGWFADPVLNTFVHYPEAELARLVFHELAHQVIYVRDDTAFNESFAVALEREGVRRWLERGADPANFRAFERTQRMRSDFARLVVRYRGELARLYRSELDATAMRARKREILGALETEYRRSRDGEWGGYAGFDGWFAGRLNNAQLASVVLYDRWVAAFSALLAREGGDLARFYAAARELAALPKAERDGRLAGLLSRP